MALDKSADDISQLLQAGASLHVDGSAFSTAQLLEFARLTKPEARLTVANSSAMETVDLLALAQASQSVVLV